MVEKDFQQQLMKGLRSQGAYVDKWPDLARGITKPFDLCACWKDTFMPIECKLIKHERGGPIRGSDYIVRPALFKGRTHQLPRLLQLYERHQGNPYIAMCLAIIDPETKSVLEKRAWMLHVVWLTDQDTWTVESAEAQESHLERKWELIWVPGIGWTVPWMPTPNRKET